MTTLIFVHGTGDRDPHYSEVCDHIEKELRSRRPEVLMPRCPWGNVVGAKLNANGASIPLYDITRAVAAEEARDFEVALWEQLYRDPFYELRILALKAYNAQDFVPGSGNIGEIIDTRLRSLTMSSDLHSKIEEAGIDEVFGAARLSILNSSPYHDAVQGATEPLSDYYDAIARAIIAEAMAECERQQKFRPILTNALLRDDLVKLLRTQLSDDDRSVGSWVAQRVIDLAALTGFMSHLQRRRGVITDAIHPAVGDILLYQGQGHQIRRFISDCIQQALPPIVLLAHSLGGIACVDLLVENTYQDVHMLITVGSQAPLLYEIDALYSLRYGDSLPPHFPPWLNIYDLRDFLSYIGAGVFPERVQDILVDNGQPFPRSHSAYWTNPSVWNAIVQRLP